MWYQAWVITAIVLLALLGLAASNFLHDRGTNDYLSRRVPAVFGGVAFLVAVLWLDPWTAVTLSGVMTLFILVLRLGFRRGLRGVRGSLPAEAWAEITYLMVGTAGLAIGWGLLGDKWLAFVPIAFMAWGDSAAGLVRATTWGRNVPSIWPSFAMLGVCLVAAGLFQPYWIGAAGAVIATAAERLVPRSATVWDDNLNVVPASLAVMGALVTSSV